MCRPERGPATPLRARRPRPPPSREANVYMFTRLPFLKRAAKGLVASQIECLVLGKCETFGGNYYWVYVNR